MTQTESSGMLLKAIGYAYAPLAVVIGVWQWWCLNYGKDNILTLVLPMLMGAPFALTSYAHASLRPVAERPKWTRMVILWLGMPLSLVVAALTILTGTAMLYAVLYMAGFGKSDLPLFYFRFLMGEGAGSVAWGACLTMWLCEPETRASKTRLLGNATLIFAGVLVSDGLSALILRHLNKDVYLLLTSVIVTALSALINMFLSKNPLRQRERKQCF